MVISRGEDAEPLTNEQLGDRLRDLRRDGSATRRIGDPGQFSLAGAQAKTAFHFDRRTAQWGVPLGDTPTTHVSGFTMLVVAHEMGFARRVADRVVFMEAGQIIEQGAPNDLFDHPQTDRARAFLSAIMHGD